MKLILWAPESILHRRLGVRGGIAELDGRRKLNVNASYCLRRGSMIDHCICHHRSQTTSGTIVHLIVRSRAASKATNVAHSRGP